MALSRSGARRAVAGGSKGPRPLHHLVPLQPCAFSFFALPLGPSWSKRELSIWLYWCPTSKLRFLARIPVASRNRKHDLRLEACENPKIWGIRRSGRIGKRSENYLIVEEFLEFLENLYFVVALLSFSKLHYT